MIAANRREDPEKRGRDEYIRYIIEKYSNSIVKLCYTYVRNICDAEDIAEEVFLSLIRLGKTFDDEEHEKAWLLRTAINKSKNFLGSGWIKRTVPLEENMDAGIPEDDEKSAVMEAVLSLPEKYRTPIHLFYYDGYSINEIAEIIGKKPATVGTLLSRGRERLKALMIGGFDDEQIDQTI